MLTHNGKPSAVISPYDLLGLTPRPIILDCRPFDDYEFCHLDGALHTDIESVLSAATKIDHDPTKGGRHPLPSIDTWEKQLREWGVQPDSLVVAYDNAAAAEGAARAWWMLTASGVQAAVLDGGWDAAMKARLTINEDVPTPETSAFSFTQWLLPMVDMETVDKLRNAPDWILLDSRAPERWRGEAEHIDPVAGRIPGSRNIFFKENLDSDYFKKQEDLRKIYSEILGDIPPTRVITSCGSGMTACHTLLALYQAGLEGAHLYPGSFSEWCRNNKIEP
jgi:thiosulfate/3-mercaptopyruvate sulfurtransferase